MVISCLRFVSAPGGGSAGARIAQMAAKLIVTPDSARQFSRGDRRADCWRVRSPEDDSRLWSRRMSAVDGPAHARARLAHGPLASRGADQHFRAAGRAPLCKEKGWRRRPDLGNGQRSAVPVRGISDMRCRFGLRVRGLSESSSVLPAAKDRLSTISPGSKIAGITMRIPTVWMISEI